MFRILLIALLLYTGVQAQLLFPGAPSSAWAATLLVFWLMLAWQILYRRHADVVDARWFRGLAWAGSTCFGVWATFVLFSLPIDAVALAVDAARPSPGLLPDALRGGLAAAVLVTAIGVAQTLRGPVLRTVNVPVEDLHEDLEGFTIVQLSDLHVGPTIRRRYVARVVRRAMSVEADMVAITGDLIDGHPERLSAEIAPLAGLSAPLGVYYVTGNHEYYWGGERWIAAVAGLGCIPLIGRHVVVRRGHAAVLVAGVADPAARDFGLPRGTLVENAARGAPDADLRLLLAHRPGAAGAAAAAGFDLQLSGHTHGGQFFPFSLLVRLTHRYHRGLARLGRMWLYVSAGTGYWGTPHRFWVPAEIAVLKLTRAAGKNFPEEFSRTA
ncbi:MAG TPA: metallophosphoesterase [Rhodocyclaceae bacterium]